MASGIEEVKINLIFKEFSYLLGNRLSVFHIVFADSNVLLSFGALINLETNQYDKHNSDTYFSLLGLILH